MIHFEMLLEQHVRLQSRDDQQVSLDPFSRHVLGCRPEPPVSIRRVTRHYGAVPQTPPGTGVRQAPVFRDYLHDGAAYGRRRFVMQLQSLGGRAPNM